MYNKNNNLLVFVDCDHLKFNYKCAKYNLIFPYKQNPSKTSNIGPLGVLICIHYI